MPTALAQQARRTTSTITTAVTQQSATQRSLESANRNLFSLTAASQTSVTLFHISKTVCAQSANVMAMATALGKIKIEPKNLTWQAVVHLLMTERKTDPFGRKSAEQKKTDAPGC